MICEWCRSNTKKLILVPPLDKKSRNGRLFICQRCKDKDKEEYEDEED